MRPIPLILACLTPVAIGGLVYVAYERTPRPERQVSQQLNTYDVAEAPMQAMAPPAIAPPADRPDFAASETATPLKVSVPKIAYSYSYSFALPAAEIVRAQETHVALCDRLGPARCQLLAMSNGSSDDGTVAHLKLRVASAIARRFGGELERSVAQAGGRAANRSIAAEDVSKDVSDTEARLRQRELLVSRLTEVLRTRRGTVAELVEAERSVAAAQEEIDQAKSWLGELQSRLAMSSVEIDYKAAAVLTAPAPAKGFGSTTLASLATFATGIGGLLTAVIFALPWASLLALLWLGWWRFRHLWRRATDYAPDEPDAEAAPS